MKRTILCGVITASAICVVSGQGSSPSRYVNPLPIPGYPLDVAEGRDFRSAADPTVFRHKDKWYLYPSNGLAWWSSDMVRWHYQKVEIPGATGVVWAPTVMEHDGAFYLTANNLGLFRAAGPLGPWELVGPFRDEDEKIFRPFDPMLFRDDDGRVFFYWAGGAAAGIYGVELDRKNLTRFAGQRTHLLTFDPTHKWEKAGDMNELSSTWIEGPWVTKYRDRYYLQYSAPGTEYKTYAVGLYIGDGPLGPFRYDPRSPILADRSNLLNGTAHHSLVEGPNGTHWMVYHVLYRNRANFERRLAMDPVGFDREGAMVVHGPTDTPQWAPGAKSNPWRDNDSGSVPLSVNKIVMASSAAPGRSPEYAVDNEVRTWWEATEDDREPRLSINLQQEFMVDSARILWSEAGIDLKRGFQPGPYQYKIEGSSDGKAWTTILDKTRNEEDMNIQFDEIPPVKASYVRLVVNRNPARPPVAVLEFTVFGK